MNLTQTALPSVLPLHKPPSPQRHQALLQAPCRLLGQSTGLDTDYCSPTAPASPTITVNPSPRSTTDIHVCLFMLQQQSWAISTETIWLTKPKILFGLYRKLCKSRSRTAFKLEMCTHLENKQKTPYTVLIQSSILPVHFLTVSETRSKHPSSK